jgi:xanthine dehydrogenase accessory factor
MDHKVFWLFLKNEIQTTGKAALVKVVKSEGPSPGKRGFMMAVAQSGAIRGTIGGGVMESNIIDETLQILSSDEKKLSYRVLEHKKNVPNASGLICSGLQVVVIAVLTSADIYSIDSILKYLSQRKAGGLTLSSEGFVFNTEVNSAEQFQYNYTDDQHWLFIERYGRPDTVYVFGSGHVGLSVCKLFKTLNFYVVAIDHRQDAPTVKGNSYADEIHIMPYSQAAALVEEGAESFVVIVTSDRDSDLLSLQTLIHKQVRYIGLMGSDSKIGSIFKDLKKSGVDGEELKKINAPIGIPISSNTPDEIAVSILAQVIQERNS